MLIWEREPSSSIHSVQVSVYANPDNSGKIKLRVESGHSSEMEILPGNTATFLGAHVQRIHVSVPNPDPSTHAEGRYSVTAEMICH
jgi:hypothetical protein